MCCFVSCSRPLGALGIRSGAGGGVFIVFILHYTSLAVLASLSHQAIELAQISDDSVLLASLVESALLVDRPTIGQPIIF